MEADKQFFKLATIEAFVPENSEDDLQALLQSNDEYQNAAASSTLGIKKRDVLFIGTNLFRSCSSSSYSFSDQMSW